jgi:hypothetical protein
MLDFYESAHQTGARLAGWKSSGSHVLAGSPTSGCVHHDDRYPDHTAPGQRFPEHRLRSSVTCALPPWPSPQIRGNLAVEGSDRVVDDPTIRMSCAPPPPPASAGCAATPARSPMARPRALVCLGWSHWLQGRHGAARRAWTRAIGEAERLAMPWELAHAHHQLGRHLAAGQRSPLGLDRTGHLNLARSTLAALGCRTDPRAPTGTDGLPT